MYRYTYEQKYDVGRFVGDLLGETIGLFGEKYGKTVRTIKFGDSYELCGGTHVRNTMNIRNFLIISENSIASGIRRIEAISGKKSINYLSDRNNEINQLKSILSSNKKIQFRVYLVPIMILMSFAGALIFLPWDFFKPISFNKIIDQPWFFLKHWIHALCKCGR